MSRHLKIVNNKHAYRDVPIMLNFMRINMN